MAITYADIPLLVRADASGLLNWLDEVGLPHWGFVSQTPKHATSGRRDSKTDWVNARSLAVPNYPDPPRPRINALYWPTGAMRWSWFYGIVDTERLDAIISKVSAASSTDPPRLRIGGLGRTEHLGTQMYMLPPRKLTSPGGSLDGRNQALWLLPLVDERYFWQSQYHDYGEKTSSSDWDDLFDTLSASVTSVGGEFSVNAVVSAYGKPPYQELDREYDSVPPLLDSAAHSVGMRVVRYLDGSVNLLNWASSESSLDGNRRPSSEKWNLLAGDEFDQKYDAPVYPPTLRIAFRRYKYNRVVVDYYEKDEAIASHSSRSQQDIGATYRIHSTALANYSTGSIGNQTNLDNLASQIASDFYDSLKYRYDYTFAGFYPWLPCGYDDYVMWNYDEGITRVCSSPCDFGIDSMLHWVDDLEILSPLQYATLDEDLDANSTADVSVGSHTINVEDKLIEAGKKIASGAEIYIGWFEDDEKWRPISVGECTEDQ